MLKEKYKEKTKKNYNNDFVEITLKLRHGKSDNFKIKNVSEYYKLNKDNLIISFNRFNSKFDKKTPTIDEIRVAKKIARYFDFNIEFLHRVNENNVKTPDIRNINPRLLEYWEIKSIHKSLNAKSKNNKICHILYSAKNQSSNVIIDLTRKDCDLSNEEAINQLLDAFNNKLINNWLNQVILIGKNNFVKYYKKRTALGDCASFSSSMN